MEAEQPNQRDRHGPPQPGPEHDGRAQRHCSQLRVVAPSDEHIQRILQGEKTVELRKTRPAVEAGQPAALYATAPTSAVVATCVIDRVVVGIPGQLRSALLGPARVTAQEYDAYLSGSQQAVAIYLRDVSVLHEPITLDHIRQSRAWHPPQTWHFLHPDHLADLVGNHMALSQLQIAL